MPGHTKQGSPGGKISVQTKRKEEGGIQFFSLTRNVCPFCWPAYRSGSQTPKKQRELGSAGGISRSGFSKFWTTGPLFDICILPTLFFSVSFYMGDNTVELSDTCAAFLIKFHL